MAKRAEAFKKTLVPVAVVGQVLKITGRRVQQLAAEGHIPKASRGRYNLVAAVQGYVTYLQEQLEKRATERSDGFEKQRLRHQTAKAALAELDLAQVRGELIGLADIEEGVTTLCSGITSQVLALPAALAEDLAALDDPKACHAILEEAFRSALTSVADATTRIPAEARDRRRRGAADRGRTSGVAAAAEAQL